MSRLIILLLLPITLLLAVAGPADAAERAFEFREYRVEVTGLQVTDWSYRSAQPLNDEAGWTTGEGVQTIGWSTTRPGNLHAVKNTLRRVGPLKLPPFQLQTSSRAPRLRGTIRRTATVQKRDPRPACEGSNHDPECLFVPLPITVPQACGRKPLPVQTNANRSDENTRDLVVVTSFEARDAFEACAPDSSTPVLSNDFRFPADITFRRVARRLSRVRVGRTLKLHRERRSAGCPLQTDRAGFAACSTTDVTVELTRIS